MVLTVYTPRVVGIFVRIIETLQLFVYMYISMVFETLKLFEPSLNQDRVVINLQKMQVLPSKALINFGVFRDFAKSTLNVYLSMGSKMY